MARLDSFYLPPDKWTPPYTLEGDEARHALKVLRLAPGARLRLFDGQGREGVFVLEQAKGGVTLSLESQATAPEPAVRTWLALGWNKSSRRGWLMEKASELGAAGIMFWRSSRSQGAMPEAPKDTWRAQLVAGAKQCGNPWLPAIEMVQGGAAGISERCRGFAGRYLPWESRDVTRGLGATDLTAPGSRVFVLGPEGGLTREEAEIFTGSGFSAVTLGPRPLRWETAALLCLGLSWWGANQLAE